MEHPRQVDLPFDVVSENPIIPEAPAPVEAKPERRPRKTHDKK